MILWAIRLKQKFYLSTADEDEVRRRRRPELSSYVPAFPNERCESWGAEICYLIQEEL